MYTSKRDRILELAEENNKLLKNILTILVHENTSDFENNIIANLLGNAIMPSNRH